MQPGEAHEVMSPEASIGASAVTSRVRRWAKAKSAFRPPVKDPLCVGPRTPTCMTRPSESRWVNRQSRADPPGLPRSGPARVPARKVAPGVREASEPRPARVRRRGSARRAHSPALGPPEVGSDAGKRAQCLANFADGPSSSDTARFARSTDTESVSSTQTARPPVFPIANACDYDIGGFTIVAIVRCDRRARLRSAKSDAATDSG